MKNPWLLPGLAAGIAIAIALVLVWPSPAKVSEKVQAVTRLEPTFTQGELCRKCEERNCKILVDSCFPAEGTKPPRYPDAGGPVTPEMTAGCQEVLECVRRTGCANDEHSECYCGKGVDWAECWGGKVATNGACKDVIRKHAGTESVEEIGLRFGDYRYPLGLAFLLRLCDDSFCREVCR